MVEEDRVDIATGEVGRERWYLLTSLSSRRCGPKALPRRLPGLGLQRCHGLPYLPQPALPEGQFLRQLIPALVPPVPAVLLLVHLLGPPQQLRNLRLQLRVFRQHWSVENSLNHGKNRSWDEDLHTLRRPGLGVGIRHPGEHRDQCPAPVRMASTRMSMPLRANSCAFRPIQTITSLYGRATWLCNHPGGRGRDF